eukprot:GHVO01056760.1.p1 GENE.GHVO01056760.1~~GHVO01056760.1.p1  ORF type:complete len:446 (+),score=94.08 GHVO01056760.1:191-1339(+)
MHANVKNLLGHGMVIHLDTLIKEIKMLEASLGRDVLGTIWISSRAHLLFDIHQSADANYETFRKEHEARFDSKTISTDQGTIQGEIGTTKRGIGPAYASKGLRLGIRAGDLNCFSTFEAKYKRLHDDITRRFGASSVMVDMKEELERHRGYAEYLKGRIVDGISVIHAEVAAGGVVVAEGANAALLDIDVGTYPYVTSSSTVAAGACIGLGIPPSMIGDVIGVTKAYTTRVGGGPFPTEDTGAAGKALLDNGKEFGTTTGRPRRCGWMDIPVLKHSGRINGTTAYCLTKLDALTGLTPLRICTDYENEKGERYGPYEFPPDLTFVKPVYVDMPGWTKDIRGVTAFADLPQQAQAYVQAIERHTGVPVRWIGTGPDRAHTIHM